MIYLLIVFGIVIFIESLIIYKLTKKDNASLLTHSAINTHQEKVLSALSDKYLKLISSFSFSVEEIYMEMKEISYKVENVMSESEEQAAGMVSISNVIEDIYHDVETNLANSETSSEISKNSYEEISTKIMQLNAA